MQIFNRIYKPISDRAFLERRNKLIKAWSYTAILLMLLLLGLALGLYLFVPLFINPYQLIAALKTQSLDYGTLELLAAMVPLLVLMIFLVLLSLIGFMHSMMQNEKRYQKIIRQQNEVNPNE